VNEVIDVKIWDLYRLAIEMGKASDPRTPEQLEADMDDRCQEYESLSEHEQANFDTEMLTNPYPDTRLLFGEPSKTVKHLFMGIDIGVSELLLVDRLNAQGAGIDLVVAHHPEGIALTTLHKAMDLQTGIFSCCGVPVNVADQILQVEAGKTAFSLKTGNYNQVVDAARLMQLPFMCVHTPTDNLAQRFWEERFAENPPRRVGDIIEMLMEEPEYVEASKLEAGPEILVGSAHNRAGRIMVDMTGGTDAGPVLYEKLAAAGIGTIVAMHLSEGVKEVLEKAHINIVIAGHMSSDSLGLNLWLDEVEAQGIKITAGSGFTRCPR
jgi:hypothetical protein